MLTILNLIKKESPITNIEDIEILLEIIAAGKRSGNSIWAQSNNTGDYIRKRIRENSDRLDQYQSFFKFFGVYIDDNHTLHQHAVADTTDTLSEKQQTFFNEIKKSYKTDSKVCLCR